MPTTKPFSKILLRRGGLLSIFDNVSARATGISIWSVSPENIPKDVRFPAALRKVRRFKSYISVRQDLIYSSYRIRGWEYKETPKIDCSKRQWSEDYQPQKRVTLVLHEPIPRFHKILRKGQCQTSFADVLRPPYQGAGKRRVGIIGTHELYWPSSASKLRGMIR